METRVYGCGGGPIEAVAANLERVLGIKLYLNHSPMIGPWYDSTDPEPMWRAFQAQDLEMLRQLSDAEPGNPSVRMRLNDPEPGYQGREFPTDDTYVVEIRGDEAVLNDLEQALIAAGLGLHPLR